MGVPSFFRWLAAKYPDILQSVLEPGSEGYSFEHGENAAQCKGSDGIPRSVVVDNLYLDCNGIVHPCCHPESGPQPRDEDEMLENIGMYLDKLVRAIKPQRLLYLALDGVAPRAKMNQQRARRFRSARDAREAARAEAELREQRQRLGQRCPPPAKEHWDSNVITPGTAFQAKLAAYLRRYASERLARQQGVWRGLCVVVSDSSVPGEGEHKIVQYIRRRRAAPDYDPTTVHAICGQDADLIMLALALHDPRVYVLREAVDLRRRRKPKRGAARRAPAEESFLSKGLELLSAGRLRQCLLADLGLQMFEAHGDGVLSRLAGSEERLLDDFVFLCFFVGNDFLPHLPCLEIREGGLDLVLLIYVQLLPYLRGFLVDAGAVDVASVQAVLRVLSGLETKILRNRVRREQREEAQRRQKAAAEAKAARGAASAAEGAKTNAAGTNAAGTNAAEGNAVAANAAEANAAAANAAETNAAETSAAETNAAETNAAETNAAEAKAAESAAAARGDEGASITYEDDLQDRLSDDEDDGLPAAVGSLAAGVAAMAVADGGGREGGGDGAAEWKEAVEAALLAGAEAAAAADEGSSAAMRLGESGWKRRYYAAKLGARDAASERHRMCFEYFRGLCWVARYYYQGCPSWGWFYPFHHSPCASDMLDDQLRSAAGAFALGRPLPPLAQLMAVLPAASAHCLPPACAALMADAASPLAAYYPEDFAVDPNGRPARVRWLWIALLPFIDEARLLAALADVLPTLREEERRRNAIGCAELLVAASHPSARRLAEAAAPAAAAAAPLGAAEGLGRLLRRADLDILRAGVQQDRRRLNAVLPFLGRDDPPLLAWVADNQAAFVAALNAAVGAGPAPPAERGRACPEPALGGSLPGGRAALSAADGVVALPWAEPEERPHVCAVPLPDEPPHAVSGFSPEAALETARRQRPARLPVHRVELQAALRGCTPRYAARMPGAEGGRGGRGRGRGRGDAAGRGGRRGGGGGGGAGRGSRGGAGRRGGGRGRGRGRQGRGEAGGRAPGRGGGGSQGRGRGRGRGRGAGRG